MQMNVHVYSVFTLCTCQGIWYIDALGKTILTLLGYALLFGVVGETTFLPV